MAQDGKCQNNPLKSGQTQFKIMLGPQKWSPSDKYRFSLRLRLPSQIRNQFGKSD